GQVLLRYERNRVGLVRIYLSLLAMESLVSQILIGCLLAATLAAVPVSLAVPVPTRRSGDIKHLTQPRDGYAAYRKCASEDCHFALRLHDHVAVSVDCYCEGDSDSREFRSLNDRLAPEWELLDELVGRRD